VLFTTARRVEIKRIQGELTENYFEEFQP